MASGKKDRDGLFRRGQIYYCWIRGERQSTRCRSRKAALAVRDQLERAAVDPVYRASYVATVGELCAVTLEEVERRGRKAGTLDYYKSKLGQVVRGLGAETPLAEITVEMVDQFIDTRRGEGAARHTISKELGALRHMLRVARRRRAFAGDVDALFPVGFDVGYNPRKRYLTWEEIPRLLSVLGVPRLRAWVALAIATGARESEVARAERSDVSEALDVVQIRGTKTDLSDDAVAIPLVFQPLLQLALDLGAETGPLVGIWSNSVRDLAAAAERAGIPRVGPNDLRRTHATLLRAGGVPLDLISRQLRHADTRQVVQTYGRLTAKQVAGLLPRVSSTVQIVPTVGEAVTESEDDRGINAGVDDGNRTRDNWSHKPEAYHAQAGNTGKSDGSDPVANARDPGAPATNSPVLLRVLAHSSELPAVVRVALLERAGA
jgi:integrase